VNIPISDDQKAAVNAALNDGAVPVHAYRNGNTWQVRYLFPCQECGEHHIGGAGSGDMPDLPIGTVGSWSRDCVGAGLGHDVSFVLAEVEV